MQTISKQNSYDRLAWDKIQIDLPINTNIGYIPGFILCSRSNKICFYQSIEVRIGRSQKKNKRNARNQELRYGSVFSQHANFSDALKSLKEYWRQEGQGSFRLIHYKNPEIPKSPNIPNFPYPSRNVNWFYPLAHPQFFKG